MFGTQRLKHPERSKPVIVLCSAVLVTGLLSGLRHYGGLQALELYAYDQLMQLRPPPEYLSAAPILLLELTEQDLEQFGHPLSDQLMSAVLQKLLTHRPRAIGVDIFRDQPSHGHTAFQELIQATPDIVLIEKILGTPVAGPDFPTDRVQLGFADLKQDHDGRIRRGLLIVWPDTTNAEKADAGTAPPPYALSFSAQLALRYLDDLGIGMTADPEDINQVQFGQTVLRRFQPDDGGYRQADAGGYQFLMDYRRAPQRFERISVSDILTDQVAAAKVQERIVLIGTTAASVQDQHETPFSHNGQGPLYGIEIHAHQLDQLIRMAVQGDRVMATLSDRQETVIMAAWSLFGAVLGLSVHTLWAIFATALLAAVLPILLGYAVFLLGWWLPPVGLSLASLLALLTAGSWIRMLEYTERQLIMQLFGRFVSAPVAKALWRQRDELLDQGHVRPRKLHATILMSDLKGYTTVSEAMPATEVMEWINSYMSVMTGIIEAHQGIVEDYAGDGIKASFGTPIPRTNAQAIAEDARRAVACAQAMGEAFTELHAHWHGQRAQSEYLRIGISSGEVVAGCIGNAQRMAYTTVGDIVNSAARLECLNKDTITTEDQVMFRVLLDESTYRQVSAYYQADYLGPQQVRGKQQALQVYQLSTG